MKARAKWVENVTFVAETGSGHSIVVDGAPEAGGRNIGVRPMELVLAGAAACTAFDVVWTQHSGMNIADKERLYREIRRDLRPSGCLALEEIMTGSRMLYCSARASFDSPWYQIAPLMAKGISGAIIPS